MNVVQGDCLEIMRKLIEAEVTFDAVITDPPYALTKGDDTPYHALRVLFQIIFPNLDQLETQTGDQFLFSGIPVTVSNLNLVNWAIGVESRIGVPKGAIDFYREFHIWQYKVNDGGKSSEIISDNKLSDEIDIENGQFLGDYILDLRDTWKFARTNGYASSFAELSSGRLTVPVCAIYDPSSPSLLARFCSVILGADSISLGDDPSCHPCTHTDSFAHNRTVNSFVLGFDLGRGSIELCTTNRTFTGNNFSSIVPPKLVAALPATGGLSSEFQSVRVGCVCSATNRTNAFFNLWLHKNWVRELSRIYSSGGFMGKVWDDALPDPEVWRLAYDLLVPGGHLVVFGGTRTYHRLCCAIEDAGFEIRDQLAWVYGSGLPHGLNVEKALGERPEAKEWRGWNTTLKPSWEPIVLARKPFPGSVPENVLKHGTAALNIGACRIPIDETIDDPRLGGKGTWGTANMAKNIYGDYQGIRVGSSPDGRYPPNLIHDKSEEVLELFAQYGERGGGDKRGQCQGRRPGGFGDVGHDKGDQEPNATVYADKGSAARFFSKCPYNNDELFEHHVQNILEQCLNNIFVPNAGVHFTTIPVITENTVPKNVQGLLGDSLSLNEVANDVVLGSIRTNAVRNIVQNVVATASMQRSTLIDIDCREPSMTVTVSELKQLLTNVIVVILSIVGESSQERLQEKLFQLNNHARDVVIQKQTDTMTITISRWKSDGYVGPVIFNIMLPSMVRGGTDSISRFIYAAKADKKQRRGSKHPTVKPISLMRWLVKLITPPNGIILDPFAGTGTTAEAAILEGFEYVLIERENQYIQDIKTRLENYNV